MPYPDFHPSLARPQFQRRLQNPSLPRQDNSTNGPARPCNIKPQQRSSLSVLQRSVEPTAHRRRLMISFGINLPKFIRTTAVRAKTDLRIPSWDENDATFITTPTTLHFLQRGEKSCPSRVPQRNPVSERRQCGPTRTLHIILACPLCAGKSDPHCRRLL